MESVIEYWAKHGCAARFPQFHGVCKEHFDLVLAKLWKKAQAAKVPRRNWMIGKSESLSLFLDVDDAVNVDEAVRKKKIPHRQR